MFETRVYVLTDGSAVADVHFYDGAETALIYCAATIDEAERMCKALNAVFDSIIGE